MRLRGDWADTGPDSGAEDPEESNPVIRRILSHFQKYVEIQARDASEAESASNSASGAGTVDSSKDKDILQCFRGHRNSRTMIKKANFYGTRSEFVLSGSDDGRMFIWDKKSGELLNYLVGDKAGGPFFLSLLTKVSRK